jgi:predicted nucleic acid-binding protein
VTFVLDSWAVLALLEGTEPAASRVQAVLDEERPAMSWINAGEVYYVVRRSEGAAAADEVIRDLRAVVTLETPSAQRVLQAAALKARHPMAYADAFAAATAIARDGTLLTGDPELMADGRSWAVEDLRV